MIWKNGEKSYWPGWNSFSECVAKFCREGVNAGRPGPCPDPEKQYSRHRIKTGRVAVKKEESAKKPAKESNKTLTIGSPKRTVKAGGAKVKEKAMDNQNESPKKVTKSDIKPGKLFWWSKTVESPIRGVKENIVYPVRVKSVAGDRVQVVWNGSNKETWSVGKMKTLYTERPKPQKYK